MANKLENYLSDYVKNNEPTFEKYILAAFENEEHRLFYLASFQGKRVPSVDLRNCEFLKDAELFASDTKVSNNDHNTYKIFCLTEKGQRFAQRLRKIFCRPKSDQK